MKIFLSNERESLMGKLKADLERIKRAKKQIDAYIQVHKQCIGKISNNASQLAAFWEGSDALAFQTQFERLIGNGSESEVLLKKMVSLTEYLDFVYKSYSEEQKDACSRAARL